MPSAEAKTLKIQGSRMTGPDPGTAKGGHPLRVRTEGPDPGTARGGHPCTAGQNGDSGTEDDGPGPGYDCGQYV